MLTNLHVVCICNTHMQHFCDEGLTNSVGTSAEDYSIRKTQLVSKTKDLSYSLKCPTLHSSYDDAGRLLMHAVISQKLHELVRLLFYFPIH